MARGRRYPKMKVAVLEKASEVAAHQSGHNSGVVGDFVVCAEFTSLLAALV